MTIIVPGVGAVGPATLTNGKLEVPGFTFPNDGGFTSIDSFTLNLTANDRLEGDFTLSWTNGVATCRRRRRSPIRALTDPDRAEDGASTCRPAAS